MRRAVLTVLSGLLALGAATATAAASLVTIHVGQYSGRYFLFPNGGAHSGPYTGDVTLDLAANTYTIDTGAGLGNSGFAFDVDASGTVANVSPEAAAVASGATVTFNNATITISAGTYTGRYFLSMFGTGVVFHGDASVVVLPGLAYTLDDGSEAGGSSFAFLVDAAGDIVVNAPAATANGSTLSLVTTPVTIDPQAFSGTYYISAFEPTPLVGKQTVQLMPGLTYSLDDGAHVGSSSLLFDVDASGAISSSSSAVSTSGNTLAMANVFVTINPGCYSGTYRVSGYGNQQGLVTLALIPTIGAVISTSSGDAVFVPQLGGIPIALPCFSLTGSATATSPYAAAIQSPIKSDGSSVFNANRGVVPVKFTLAFNGAATCQLPPATISLVQTSGGTASVVNQDVYLQSSDNGTNFRIDPTSCQYVYNLGTSSLGAGTYVIQISINGTVVGRGTFGMK